MRKEVLNILYWNIHYEAGTKIIKKDKLDYAADFVIKHLDNFIEEKSINVVILTEAYPQIEEGNENNKILKHYKDDFDVFPYEPSNDFIKRKYKANYCFAVPKFSNSVIIMTKKCLGFKIDSLQFITEYPNLLSIKNDKVQILGLRFCQGGYSIIDQVKRIKGEIKFDENKPVIAFGDYNPSLLRGKLIENELLSMNINKKDHPNNINVVYDELFKKILNINKSCTIECSAGTNVNKNGEDTFPDKLTLFNIGERCINNVIFDRLKTAEELYFRDEDIDHKTYHLKDKKFDKAIMKEKEEFERLKVYIKSYKNSGLSVIPPFPDHNLLFASIDIGYDE